MCPTRFTEGETTRIFTLLSLPGGFTGDCRLKKTNQLFCLSYKLFILQIFHTSLIYDITHNPEEKVFPHLINQYLIFYQIFINSNEWSTNYFTLGKQ